MKTFNESKLEFRTFAETSSFETRIVYVRIAINEENDTIQTNIEQQSKHGRYDTYKHRNRRYIFDDKLYIFDVYIFDDKLYIFDVYIFDDKVVEFIKSSNLSSKYISSTIKSSKIRKSKRTQKVTERQARAFSLPGYVNTVTQCINCMPERFDSFHYTIC